jgi:hypothetical protein
LGAAGPVVAGGKVFVGSGYIFGARDTPGNALLAFTAQWGRSREREASLEITRDATDAYRSQECWSDLSRRAVKLSTKF